MTAKVIDFFVEAGKRHVGFSRIVDVPVNPRADEKHLTPLQVRMVILMELLINEIRSGHADPTNFFVLYGKPWEENPREMLWHYLTLEFTPETLTKGVDQILADMKRRKK